VTGAAGALSGAMDGILLHGLGELQGLVMFSAWQRKVGVVSMRKNLRLIVFTMVTFALAGFLISDTSFGSVKKHIFGDKYPVKTPLEIICPDDIRIDCSVSPDPEFTGFPVISGGCSPYDTSYTDDLCPGRGHTIYKIARTWTVTDCQGLQVSCSQLISVIDTVPPEITCPPDVKFSCDDVGDFGEPSVEDNCDPNPNVAYEDSIIYMHAPDACPYEYVMLRTWTATDAAGNSSFCVQRIVIDDSEAPQITFCPQDQTVACDSEIANLPHATAVDNCNPEMDEVPFEYSYEAIRRAGDDPCNYQIIRLWQFHDGCCNTSSCQQVVTVKDTIPPVLVCAPDDTINCQSIPIFTDPEISDNCSEEPSFTVVLTDTIIDPTGGGRIFRRCWKGVDRCGNESDTCCQHIYQAFCQAFCSFTIGGWGSRCPRPQVDDRSSTQPGCIRDHYFDQVFPEGVTIGVEGSSDAHMARWTTAGAIEDYLPDGGKPGYLTDDLLNAATTPAGVLASQVLALRLNREYSCYGVFDSLEMSSGVSCYGDFIIPEGCGKFAGMTVDEFLGIADQAVGGRLSVLEPYDASLSDVNNTATCLNELYVDCRLNAQQQDDTIEEQTPKEPSIEDEVLATSSSAALALQASPNPVAGKTKITFLLPSSGKVVVEIYNIQGKRIKTLNSGWLDEGAHSVVWRGDDEAGNRVSPGVYFCRLRFDTDARSLEKLIKL